jgi:phage shock protein A
VDDFDLDGLTPEQARAYVAEFIATQKQTLKQLEDAENDLAAWKKRATLALEQSNPELAREAVARAEECLVKIGKLKQEAASLDFKVMELKRRLKMVEEQPQMTVNAQALLDQIESVVGTDHETSHAIADAEAEAALEALKRKMAGDSDPRSTPVTGAEPETETEAAAQTEPDPEPDG